MGSGGKENVKTYRFLIFNLFLINIMLFPKTRNTGAIGERQGGVTSSVLVRVPGEYSGGGAQE